MKPVLYCIRYNAVYIVLCKYTLQYNMYNAVYNALFTELCSLYIIGCIYTLQYNAAYIALYTEQCSLYIVLCIHITVQCSLYCTVYRTIKLIFCTYTLQYNAAFIVQCKYLLQFNAAYILYTEQCSARYCCEMVGWFGVCCACCCWAQDLSRFEKNPNSHFMNNKQFQTEPISPGGLQEYKIKILRCEDGGRGGA